MKHLITVLTITAALILAGCSMRTVSVPQAADPVIAEREKAEQTAPSEDTHQMENAEETAPTGESVVIAEAAPEEIPEKAPQGTTSPKQETMPVPKGPQEASAVPDQEVPQEHPAPLAEAESLQMQPEEIPAQEEQRESEELQMKLSIDGTAVSVVWEDNTSVDALKSLLENGSVTVSMSGYGGFEMVGSLPQRLPSHDSQMTTTPGDIVLYNSSSLVLFYGSNSWAYTRLGKITGLDQDQLRELMSSATEVTLSLR